MRILVDMDEVIYDLITPWLKMYNKDYRDNVTENDILSWDMSFYTKAGKDIYRYLEDSNVYTNGTIIPGSIEITEKWQDLGHEVGIVTSVVISQDAYPIAAEHKLMWIERFFPHLLNHVHILTGKTKHWFDADILIDDAVHNLEHFKGKGILMDKPWNREETRYTRVRNWQEIDIAVLTHTIAMNRDYFKSREIRLEY